jgi:hypothetical protein
MKFTMNLILAAAAAMTLAAGGALLDGPSDADIERATAADLADAKLAAQRFERDLRACKRAMGPSADLVQIAGSDDYVCREMPIEPTPASVLHKYAQLGEKK